MNILQSGIEKSGNYWLYMILRNILGLSGIKFNSYIRNQPIYSVAKNWSLSQHNQAEIDVLDIYPDKIINRISNIYQMPIYDIDNYLAKSTITWTHLPFFRECLPIYKKFNKIIYITRDPRSILLSKEAFLKTDYIQNFKRYSNKDRTNFLKKRLELSITGWCLRIINYLAFRKELGIHTVFYENLKRWPNENIYELAKYLEIELSKEEIARIVSNTNFNTMKKINPQHIRKGNIEWENKLTQNQKKKIRFIAGPVLKATGYNLNNAVGDEKVAVKKEITNKQLHLLYYRTLFKGVLLARHKIISFIRRMLTTYL